jgi:DNA polymerase V
MKIVTLANSSKIKINLVVSKVKAGFPSPAEDYIDKRIDLNQQLIDNPASTFMVRVEGDSMVDASIYEDDVLIVDKAIQAKDGDIILAIVDGEFTVKRLKIKGGNIMLVPESQEYEPIYITEESSFSVWGVVTYIIHKTK